LDFEDAVDDAAEPDDVPDPEPEPEPVELVELVELEGLPSDDDDLAAAWNVENDLFAVGLTAKTMPFSQ
jgi:hypothetical protein